MTRQTRRMRAGVSANLKRPTNQGNEISFISTRRVCVVLFLLFFAIFLWHQASSRTSCALHHMPALWAARAVQTTAADSCAKSRKKMRKIENKKTRNYRISI